MAINELFIMASRQKFRFPFKGVATVEDLWDLGVRDLDTIFKSLNSQKKQAQEESLLSTKSKEESVLEAKIEIVKRRTALLKFWLTNRMKNFGASPLKN